MKRARRAAAESAMKKMSTSSSLVAEISFGDLQVAVTSQDVLEDLAQRERVFKGVPETVVVTLHTDERPKRLPRGTVHINAAFDDSQSFEDSRLAQHLDVAHVERLGNVRGRKAHHLRLE